MGCDIHILAETIDDCNDQKVEWLILPFKFKRQRDYVLFAILANVRNAWSKESIENNPEDYAERDRVPVIPISEPRGFPADWGPTKRNFLAETLHYSFGPDFTDGHSDSYLIFDEVFDWIDKYPEWKERIKYFADELQECMKQNYGRDAKRFRLVFNFDN